MTEYTPVLGLPYVEGTDTVTTYPVTSLELAQTVEGELLKLGATALYTTNGIALAAGDNTVNLTTLLAGDGTMFPLVGGAVTTAIGGTFLLIYDFDIDGFNTQIMGGPATAYPGETASITAAAVNGLSHASLHTMVVRQAAASEAFPRPYARVMPNGANATIRLTVVRQG